MDAISNDKNADERSGTDVKSAQGTRRVPMIDNCIQSADLFASTREITIAHGSDLYRLRLTSQNKLILTK